MKDLRFYTIAACAASLGAAGCAGAGVNAGPPQGAPMARHAHRSGQSGTVHEYTIPDDGKSNYKAFPVGITNGPDGAMWFTERGWGQLGRITTDGTITGQFSLQVSADDPGRFPMAVTTGPDGNLWATCGTNRTYIQESHGNPDEYGSIRQMSPLGLVLNVLPLPTNYSDPRTITTGPDGNLWFTEKRGAIGQLTPGGTLLNEFPVQSGNGAFQIIVGPDRNLWFGETNNDILGRITTGGSATYFNMPSGGGPAGIVAGPDGYLYIAEFVAGKIAQVTTSGVIQHEWALTKQSYPKGMAIGSDGNLYVAEFGTSKIAELVLSGSGSGTIKEFPTLTGGSGPWYLVTGPDGNIWFTESSKDKIGELTI